MTSTTLAYDPRWVRVLNALLPVPVVAAALAAWRYPPAAAPELFWPLAAIFAVDVLALWLARVEVAGVRHEVTRDGIEAHSPWRRRVAAVRWRDVASVRWSAAGQCLVIRGFGGETIRVSRWLSGMGALARALQENVTLDDTTVAGAGIRPRLAELSRGERDR